MYMAASQHPKNKNVIQALQEGLQDVRVFSSKMPSEVVVYPERHSGGMNGWYQSISCISISQYQYQNQTGSQKEVLFQFHSV